MKKVMFGLAAAAAIGAFAIESANVVGYNTVTINKEYTILGIPFTGTTGSAMSIQDAVPYSAGMTKGNGSGAADSIQIMDANGNYDIYFMCNGYRAKAAVTGGDGKWVKTDGSAAVSTAVLPMGTGAWFVRKSGSLANIKIVNPNAE